MLPKHRLPGPSSKSSHQLQKEQKDKKQKQNVEPDFTLDQSEI